MADAAALEESEELEGSPCSRSISDCSVWLESVALLLPVRLLLPGGGDAEAAADESAETPKGSEDAADKAESALACCRLAALLCCTADVREETLMPDSKNTRIRRCRGRACFMLSAPTRGEAENSLSKSLNRGARSAAWKFLPGSPRRPCGDPGPKTALWRKGGGRLGYPAARIAGWP